MLIEFSCRRCDGASVVLPSEFDEDTHITCRSCGALQGTLADLRQTVTRSQKHYNRHATFSGC